MRITLFIPLVFCFLHCGTSSDSASDSGSTPGIDDTYVAPGDTGSLPGEDAPAAPAETTDAPAPQKDFKIDPGGQDTGPPPAGDKELGEECKVGAECKSGLCWAGEAGSGCTVVCASHEECQQFGLICLPLQADINGCVPPPPPGVQCGSHLDCKYPMSCIDQHGWCDLPECTWDGDCPAGQMCEQSVRKCQNESCGSTYECQNPAEFCLEGACSPPECTERADCPEGDICSKTQGICTEGNPCEGECNYYNEICIEGLCEPNLCTNPCTGGGEVCNPETGKCGAMCTSNSQCPPGWGCDPGAGACYENLPPAAVAAVIDEGVPVAAASLAAGSTAQLDGSLSADPEGATLTYKWMVLSKPVGSPVASGTIFCQSATCSLGPLTPGIYHAGLWVVDEPGSASIQDVATIFVD